MPDPIHASQPAAEAREHTESADRLRDPFDLDCHRIIECTAFRRLEGKTQVFAPHAHDHFRTRLSHTIEVAEISACLAKNLNGNVALSRAIALAHDLGHPPFGHAGETALDALMSEFGGFNHNTHSLRIVEYLEHPFPRFRGLNLTRATRDGLRTHETRYDRPESNEAAPPGAAGKQTGIGPSIEAQIASIADRAAYACHDLEDAIGAELIDETALMELELWSEAHQQALELFGRGRENVFAIRRPVLDCLLNLLVEDIVEQSRATAAGSGDDSSATTVVDGGVELSSRRAKQMDQFEAFLLDSVYRHPRIAAADHEGQARINALFRAYCGDPELLPERFRRRIDDQGVERVACDYIAGMTDRYCALAHARFVESP